MGRLFWKFFLFIWLAQMVGILATGAIFWLERTQRPVMHRDFAERLLVTSPPPAAPHLHHAEDSAATDAGPPPHRPPPLPILHVLVGLLVSLGCAAGLAWYIAQPIRQLRQAFEATAAGNLDCAIGAGMGGRRDELADLGHDFDRMSAHLRALMASQQRLLHDVSHELRSPLARLQAAIGLARQQPARLDDFLARIEREGERMNVLVGELLTLSRLEAGVSSTLTAVDVVELLDDLLVDVRFEAEPGRIQLLLTAPVSCYVQAQPALLQRALENVIRNALRFSPAGACIWLTVKQMANGRCQVSVCDQGPGVAENLLDEIFTPFFRGQGQSTGYGLGLAIARRALLAMAGRIYAENKTGAGLVVVLELPLGEPPRFASA